MRASKKEKQEDQDILNRTFGAWRRDESVEETVSKIKKAFKKSMMRHQKK